MLLLGISYQTDGLVSFFFAALRSPYVLGALILQIIGYLVWILVISKVKLGFAFALSGAFFYLLMAVFSYIFFNEKLTVPQWLGVILITAGILFLAHGYQEK